MNFSKFSKKSFIELMLTKKSKNSHLRRTWAEKKFHIFCISSTGQWQFIPKTSKTIPWFFKKIQKKHLILRDENTLNTRISDISEDNVDLVSFVFRNYYKRENLWVGVFHREVFKKSIEKNYLRSRNELEFLWASPFALKQMRRFKNSPHQESNKISCN